MKTILLQLLPALALLLLACSKPDSVQPATALMGSWAGKEALEQTGDCTWSGEIAILVSATWEVTGNTVRATINRRYDQLEVPVTMQGTFMANKLILTERRYGVCNGVPRSYNNRYEGEIIGKELVLVTLDTICPVERCIFKKTMTLTQP